MKSMKKIFAIVLCLALMSSCFVMNASAVGVSINITEDEFYLELSDEYTVTGVQVYARSDALNHLAYVDLVKGTDYTLVASAENETTKIKFTDSFLTKYNVADVEEFKVLLEDESPMKCDLEKTICSFNINTKQDITYYQKYLDFLVEKGALDISADKKSYSLNGKEVLTVDGTYVCPANVNSYENTAAYLMTLKDLEYFYDSGARRQITYIMAMIGSYCILDFSDDVTNGEKEILMINKDGSYNLEGIAQYFSLAMIKEILDDYGVIIDDYPLITDKDDKTLIEYHDEELSFTLTFAEGLTEEDNVYYNDKDSGVYYAIIFVGPEITSGDNSKWKQGSKDNLTVTSSAEFIDFVDIYVDGANVPTSAYTVAEGSTIVTLNAAYLETLAVGDHTLDVFSRTGTATATFTIEKAEEEDPAEEPTEEPTEEPKTGDNSAIGVFVALGTLAAAGFVTLKKKED